MGEEEGCTRGATAALTPAYFQKLSPHQAEAVFLTVHRLQSGAL